jgi:hypothetical protein
LFCGKTSATLAKKGYKKGTNPNLEILQERLPTYSVNKHNHIGVLWLIVRSAKQAPTKIAFYDIIQTKQGNAEKSLSGAKLTL